MRGKRQPNSVSKAKVKKYLPILSPKNFTLAFATPKPSEKTWKFALSSADKGFITTRYLGKYFVVLIFEDERKQKDFEHIVLGMEMPILRSEKNRLFISLKTLIDTWQYKLPTSLVVKEFIPKVKKAEKYFDELNYEIYADANKKYWLGTVISATQVSGREMFYVKTMNPAIMQRTSLTYFEYEIISKDEQKEVNTNFYGMIRGLENLMTFLTSSINILYPDLDPQVFNAQKEKIVDDLTKVCTIRNKSTDKKVDEIVQIVEEFKDLL